MYSNQVLYFTERLKNYAIAERFFFGKNSPNQTANT